MPTVISNQEITAYAHCSTPTCEGYDQQEVKVQRVEEAKTYIENGGDLPFFENSFVNLRFVSEDDRPCPHCGRARELAEQPRAAYQNLSGYDPDGLRKIKYGMQERKVDTEYEAP